MSETQQYIEHVDPPHNDEGWIEYALQLLWSETDGYEITADTAALELVELRDELTEKDAYIKKLEASLTIASERIGYLSDGFAPDVDPNTLITKWQADIEEVLRKAQP